MSRRANAHVVASVLLVLGAMLLAPQVGRASTPAVSSPTTGGTGLGPSGSTSGSSQTQTRTQAQTSTTTTSPVQPGNVPVSAVGNGISVATHSSAMLRRGMHFAGTVPPSDAGQIVEIERLGRETHWAWAPTAHGTVGPDGSYAAFWPANHIGRFQIRAVLESATGSVARAGVASPALTVTVYRPAVATLFGPGFYGSTTACGETLRRGTIGVANRTLKCGMLVSLYYNGRTMIVPVIDRGPYANGADWDLTMATGRALGISTTVTVGAVSLPSQ